MIYDKIVMDDVCSKDGANFGAESRLERVTGRKNLKVIVLICTKKLLLFCCFYNFFYFF